MDESINHISGYIYEPKLNYPKNDVEIDKFCSSIKNSTKFLKEYSNKCLNGVSKTIISVFAYSSNRSHKRFCVKNGSGKSKAEMISFAKCVNPNKSLVRNCYRKFLNKLSLTNSIGDAKNRIPYMCCMNVQLTNCITNELEKSKHPDCPAAVVNSYGSFFESISNNVMNSVCDGSEDSSDRCEKIARLPTAKLSPVNHKTPFPIVISIFKNL
ncbi:hypothetical protein RDWZM_007465 [Blomia tropicalis]|uniref:Uncharacterized protein n=1 Tax=Blomia tropicalis TaxID=40697 RepID=A0A9Q0RI13_BLOTA|nr:hypothetical protein RDWZM_007465 [Blomia tropicalis]